MPTGFGGQSQQRWGDNTVNQNEYMRDIQLLDQSGRVCATGDIRRKGMMPLLVFFAVDSPGVDTLLTTLQRLADSYKDANKLTVWGISESDPARTADLVKRLGVKFPILQDYDGYHAMVYGVTSLPMLYLADSAGVIQRKTSGYRESVLNDISAKVAAVAGVEPVDLYAPPAPPAEAPAPVAA